MFEGWTVSGFVRLASRTTVGGWWEWSGYVRFKNEAHVAQTFVQTDRENVEVCWMQAECACGSGWVFEA